MKNLGGEGESGGRGVERQGRCNERRDGRSPRDDVLEETLCGTRVSTQLLAWTLHFDYSFPPLSADATIFQEYMYKWKLPDDALKPIY